jgi:hypothetical protein
MGVGWTQQSTMHSQLHSQMEMNNQFQSDSFPSEEIFLDTRQPEAKDSSRTGM